MLDHPSTRKYLRKSLDMQILMAPFSVVEKSKKFINENNDNNNKKKTTKTNNNKNIVSNNQQMRKLE